MTNKTKPGLRTEAAIKKWLDIPESAGKTADVHVEKGMVYLSDNEDEVIAAFSLKDVILKRYRKRRKKK